MHPRINELSDHNTIFVGVQWPESPRLLRKHSESKRITNHADLPKNQSTIDTFSNALDATVSDIERRYRGIDITSEQTGRIQGMVVRASVDQAHALSLTPITPRTGRGSCFKDGYSPEYLLLKASLHAHIEIRRLVWGQGHGRRMREQAELQGILAKWELKKSIYTDGEAHPHRKPYPKSVNVAYYTSTTLSKVLDELKRKMHRRRRQVMRMAMSKRVHDLEALRIARKLGRLIRQLIPTSSDPLNFDQISDSDGKPFDNPAQVDAAAARTMKEWMAVPNTLNPIAKTFEDNQDAWKDLLHDTYAINMNHIPKHIQRKIADAARGRVINQEIRDELSHAMHSPFTFGKFEYSLDALASGKSPGGARVSAGVVMSGVGETLLFGIPPPRVSHCGGSGSPLSACSSMALASSRWAGVTSRGITEKWSMPLYAAPMPVSGVPVAALCWPSHAGE